MRRLAALLLTAALAAGAAPALAPAATAAPALAPAATAAAVSHRCDFSGDHWTATWGAKDLGTIQYLYAKWTQNLCGQALKTRGTCHNYITGSTYTTTSGAVKGVGVKANVQCGVDESMLAGAIDRTRADGTWQPWQSLCAPCGRNTGTGS
jgi:hypothetical protein